MKFRWQIEGYKESRFEIHSKNAKRRHQDESDNIGWQTRKKLKRSYPEQIAIRILDELKINYESELRIKPYFIDFAIKEYKIAIEIDGKQHELPDRIIGDKKKDKFLKKQGWIVHRIKFPEQNIRTNVLKILLKHKVLKQ